MSDDLENGSCRLKDASLPVSLLQLPQLSASPLLGSPIAAPQFAGLVKKKHNKVVDFSGSLPSLRAVLLVVALLAVEVAVGSVVVGEGVEQAVAVLAPEAVPVVPRSL